MYLDTQEIRLLKVALLLSVVLTCLGGCSPSEAELAEQRAIWTQEIEELRQAQVGPPSLFLYEFRLKDGTLCVGGYKAGVTCNWSKQ